MILITIAPDATSVGPRKHLEHAFRVGSERVPVLLPLLVVVACSPSS